MTTKEQERKALEQIKKIVAGLGEGSYVATALDGMFEDAEENIENDFALSWKDRAQTAEKRLSELTETYNKQICEMSAARVAAESKLENAETNLELVRKARDDWKVAYNNAQNAANEAEATVAKQEEEIIRLKAKLYDMMTK